MTINYEMQFHQATRICQTVRRWAFIPFKILGHASAPQRDIFLGAQNALLREILAVHSRHTKRIDELGDTFSLRKNTECS